MLILLPSVPVGLVEGKTASAPGKIILSGEYAVVFGYSGIAVPAPLHATASFTPNDSLDEIVVHWDAHELWTEYAQDIVNHCLAIDSVPAGTLSIHCDIPLGKGMGSSTAVLIAITKCLLGENCKTEALAIEDALNPGHSGLDFAVIWSNSPVYYKKDTEPKIITLSEDLMTLGLSLIDTGAPDQHTAKLIAWVRERKDKLHDALETIGNCTERLLNGESILTVMRDHNQAQQLLGVVTDKAKNLIKNFEQEGGAAKVIGAGSRTGGCGMVLGVGVNSSIVQSFATYV